MYLRNHHVQFEPIDHWPGKERKFRNSAPFRTSWAKTLGLLDRELYKLSAKNVVIQVDLPRGQIRQDGAPYANARMDSPRVIVSFDSKHGQLSYPCDQFDDWQDNIRAIALALEALRMVDRYGVTNTGQQYRGWQPLPPPAASQAFQSRDAAWGFLCQVVGLPASTPQQNGVTEAVIRKARFLTHPDRNGGDADRFKRVQQAAEMVE